MIALSEIRALKIISDVIKKLNLNLSGLKVLTEVGSGNYVYTPIIAALAGAEKVFAWTRDSPYGSGIDNIEKCKSLAKQFNIAENTIEFENNNRNAAHIGEADIVTNLGFVRPIDNVMLANMNARQVIPYMCEAWEVRPGDVDIETCKEKGIKVAGTWENHPDLRIFDGCGSLCVKMVHEAGFEIYQNKIVIISSDHFGDIAKDSFEKLGATSVTLVPAKDAHRTFWSEFDFIFIADYQTTINYIGETGILTDPAVPVIHLSGMLDYKWATEHSFWIYPRQNGYAKRMTRTLADLGIKPIIDLHTAGLKVGACMLTDEYNDLVQKIV